MGSSRTTINRELILPNKTLITGGFLNWTLSDSSTRVVCNVGIAYEANPRQAGVEIAFPQRDLRLRSVPPGWAPTPPAAPDGRS